MNTRNGMFGEFGGQYVPEFLLPALEEVAAAYEKIRLTESFQSELIPYHPQSLPNLSFQMPRLGKHLGQSRSGAVPESICSFY